MRRKAAGHCSAIGRKNWLHLRSKEAGPKIAALFSIVESCRKLGVPIRQYLTDVLPGLADRFIQSLAALTPWPTPPKWQKSLSAPGWNVSVRTSPLDLTEISSLEVSTSFWWTLQECV
jgi:hypothetical protein